ncbi:MAG: hypothetical protein JNK63_06645 [Chthonomonas sp.]|nr:hypothetical protein [Chthonomonas sp.]
MSIATPWIYSKKFDLLAIIGPPVAVTLIVLTFGHRMAAFDDAPLWLWILLVLGIDVAHVYSSLFRTYLDKDEFQRRRALYIVVPILSWGAGILLYAFAGAGVFWGAVAYFAIYHFVRQQYGFFMLYRRGEPVGGFDYRLDQIVIYLATIYPLVYWHTYGRNFQWFSNFEVIRIPSVWPELILRFVYVTAMLAFFGKEISRWHQTKEFNLGKVSLLLATAAAWGTGIIVFNGNLTFMLVNIVSHGVPYMALIWIYQYRKRSNEANAKNGFLRFFQLKYVPAYILALLALAYFEEGIWDWFVWKEHAELFGGFNWTLPATALAILVPLLTMPQVTHYVLDAFIWRVNKKSKEVRAVIG